MKKKKIKNQEDNFRKNMLICLSLINNKINEQISNGWGEHWTIFQIDRFLTPYIDEINKNFKDCAIIDQSNLPVMGINDYAKNIFNNVIMKNDEFVKNSKTNNFLYNIALNIQRMINDQHIDDNASLAINILIFEQAMRYKENLL